MSGKIFINYRRGDAPDSTGRLYDRLESEFATGDLFMDVEGHIKPGDDFVEVLNRQVAQCDVLLAVIGPQWSDFIAARAGDTDDFVAVEIKAALDQKKRVIPVLVGGAGIPHADTLPEPIRPLIRRNAVALRPERFKTDCQGLISALKEQLSAAEQERARNKTERLAAEAERQRREAEEAARLAAAEDRARAQSAAGLSPEEIRKAEELANWDFIKERGDIQALRDHLARFPGGVTQLYATTKLDELIWAALGPTPSLEQLRAYVHEFPKGEHAESAATRIADLERKAAEAQEADELRAKETAEWSSVASSTTASDIEAFLEKWPGGAYAEAATRTLAALRNEEASKQSPLPFIGGLACGLVLGVPLLIATAISLLLDTGSLRDNWSFATVAIPLSVVSTVLIFGAHWFAERTRIHPKWRMIVSGALLTSAFFQVALLILAALEWMNQTVTDNLVLSVVTVCGVAWLVLLYAFFRYEFRR